MKSLEILHLRLRNTGLSTTPFSRPEDVIAHLGAVQAQDFSAAKWAVGLRMHEATDEIVEKAFNDGKFLRTHVMRPTWHFVLPEDIRWMLELTAPHVKRILTQYGRRLEITAEKLSQSQEEIKKALEHKRALTRTELAEHLEKKGIRAHGQCLGHMLASAELNGLVCSGPRRGKQFTYTLLEDRVPKYAVISREDALAKLALKYFTSHGPAQVRDFAWWSGLSSKDTRKAIDTIEQKLTQINLNGKTYWHSEFSENAMQDSIRALLNQSQQAFLLSVYDEYIIAYKDRGDMSEERDIERMISMGNALTSVIILNGKAVGTWKRILTKDRIQILLSPFRKLEEGELELVRKVARRYGKFLNKDFSVFT